MQLFSRPVQKVTVPASFTEMNKGDATQGALAWFSRLFLKLSRPILACIWTAGRKDKQRQENEGFCSFRTPTSWLLNTHRKEGKKVVS